MSLANSPFAVTSAHRVPRMASCLPAWLGKVSLACLLTCIPLYAQKSQRKPSHPRRTSKTSLEELDRLSREKLVEHEPEYASIKADLGIIYSKEQKPAQALFYLLFFVSLQERQRGTKNPQSLLAYYHLFKTYQDLGAPQSARYYADKIQAILAKYSANQLRDMLKIPIKAKSATRITLTHIARATQNVDPQKSVAKLIPPPSAFPIIFPKPFQDHSRGDVFVLACMYAFTLAIYCFFLLLAGASVVWMIQSIREKKKDYSVVYGIPLFVAFPSLVMAWACGMQICSFNAKITCTQQGITLPTNLGTHGFLATLLTGLCWFFFLRSNVTIPYGNIRKVVIENTYRIAEKNKGPGYHADVVIQYPVVEYMVTLHAHVGGVEKVYTVRYRDLCEGSEIQGDIIPEKFFLFLKLLAMRDVPMTFMVKNLKLAFYKAMNF